MNRLLTNENLTISVQHLGASREPLLIIDDFLTNPDDIVAAASASQDWKDVPPGGYPGRRAGLPKPYVQAVLRRLDPIIRKRIFTTPRRLDTFECSFSIVTRSPEQLSPLQRIPHIDVANDNRVAILHYLCDERFGGTAFFRQDATGFEQIRREDRDAYASARTKDLSDMPETSGFADPTTPGYTQIGQVAAKFNRIAIYRSFTLHSGIINAPDKLTEAPATGRLTANFFVDYDYV